MFFAIIIATFGILVYSCSSDNETSLKSNDSLTSSRIQSMSKVDPANPKNNMDICGIRHNIVIEAVMNNSENLRTTDDYVKYSNLVFHEKFDNAYRIEDISTKTVTSILADSENNYSNVIESKNFSKQTTAKLKELFALINDSKSDENLTYRAIRTKIIAFEDQILASTEMTEDDKNEVLKASSIARHTLFFWSQRFGDSSTVNSLGLKRRWWQWLVIGIADVAGGVAGATAGSPTGVGAVAGAVAGAAGASSGAASLVD